MGGVHRDLREVFRQLVGGVRRWPLFLFGEPGNGKTAAALTLCDWAANRRYTTVADVVDEAYNREHWIWRDSREADCLWVVDEFGQAVGEASDRHFEAVKKLVDARELYGNRIAIYISNLVPKKLLQIYDARVVDRITCGEVFELRGPSRRRDH